jgi:hypothetical protein
MKPYKILLSFIFCFASILHCRAQSDSTSIVAADTIKSVKKPLLLTFGLDLNVLNLNGYYSYDYKGEYNIFGGGAAGWELVDHKTSYTNLLHKSNFTDVKLSVLIANSKTFQAGLSYNFGSVTAVITEPVYDSMQHPGGAKTHDITHNFVYAGISLMMEYNYYFNRKTYLGVYAFGGIDAGFYTGTDDLFGPGTPFYLQERLGLGYNLKKDIMFKAFISNDMLIYNEKETSQVFHTPETIAINLNALYIGLGISKTFTIVPD